MRRSIGHDLGVSLPKYGFHFNGKGATYPGNEVLCKGVVGSCGHNTMQTEGCAWNLTRKTSTCKKEHLCQTVNAEVYLPSDSLHFSLTWA